MIKATVQKDENDCYRGFSITGHALFANKGKDIVCAAVSMIAINTVNSIETLTENAVLYTQENGIEFRFREKPDANGSLLMDSFVLGLKGIQENYPKHLRLFFEEV